MRKYTNVKISTRDIILTLVPWAIVSAQSFYTLHVLNQLDSLKAEFANQLEKTQRLEQNLYALSEKLNTTLATAHATIQSDNLALAAQNDMTQFYIKALGISAGVIVLLVVLSKACPILFSAKALLPSFVFDIVQSYTPFFQTKQEYVIPDLKLNVDWLIHVYNDKWVEILVKTHSSAEVMGATAYVMSTKVDTLDLAVKPALGLLPVFPPEVTDLALSGFVASCAC